MQADDSAEFAKAQQKYMSAIISGDSSQEAAALKVLIRYGDRLHINTKKYKNALSAIGHTSKKHPPTQYKLQRVPKQVGKYNIQSIKVVDNKIIVQFAHKISKKDFRFFEHMRRSGYYDNFEIKGNYKYAKKTKLKLDGIDRVIVNQDRYNKLRISLKNKKKPSTTYAIDDDRLIIGLKTSAKFNKSFYTSNSNNNKIIVLDAGHGGQDQGASHKGRKEKFVTLSIVRYLKKELTSMGYKVYLTRNRDKYIKLNKRTRFANVRNANIFVSIHANAVAKRRWKYAHGVEVYFLSPARSKRAKNVAKLENNYAISSMDTKMQNVFLNILNQPKITQSNKLAIDVQSNMLYRLKNKYGTKNVIDGGVREGPFWVLVGAQMPSILIEVGYITHPTEGRRITTRAYQKLIAKAIAEGIDVYFEKNNL